MGRPSSLRPARYPSRASAVSVDGGSPGGPEVLAAPRRPSGSRRSGPERGRGPSGRRGGTYRARLAAVPRHEHHRGSASPAGSAHSSSLRPGRRAATAAATAATTPPMAAGRDGPPPGGQHSGGSGAGDGSRGRVGGEAHPVAGDRVGEKDKGESGGGDHGTRARRRPLNGATAGRFQGGRGAASPHPDQNGTRRRHDSSPRRPRDGRGAARPRLRRKPLAAGDHRCGIQPAHRRRGRVTAFLPFGGVGAWVGVSTAPWRSSGRLPWQWRPRTTRRGDRSSALADDGGDLIAAAGTGLFRLGGEGWEALGPWGDGAVPVSLAAGGGAVWVGRADPATGRGSLARVGGEAWALPDHTTVIASASMVNKVTVDAAGAVWVATNAAGVVRRSAEGTWSLHDLSTGALPSDRVLDLAADPRGGVWVATGRRRVPAHRRRSRHAPRPRPARPPGRHRRLRLGRQCPGAG